MDTYRVGVDIGGTFTDVVFLSESGFAHPLKIPSTPQDYSQAVIDGLRQGIEELGISPESITEIGHGFTVATNAILEEKGAETALITTEGFRDVLEFRRNRVPRLYDLYYEKPNSLVRRSLRFEVKERMNYKGEVVTPLDQESVNRAIDKILSAGVDSVCICLLHSYANADHEKKISEAIADRIPDLSVTLSSELLPIIKEYERTSTTVINGYVRPVVESYLGMLISELKSMGIRAVPSVMQSNGGLATPESASERPAFCIESGPAAGVMGSFHMGRQLEIDNLMTLDMGGTTAKAAIIENGEVLRSQEYEVGAGLNVGHRLLRGAGHILNVPAIDLAEVGAGGGSIARVDESGSLRVGPQSAGAKPGPVSYDQGGESPTVTDANIALGYLNPDSLLGGGFRLNSKKAEKAIDENIAKPLKLSVVEAAHGIHMLANSNMSRALRAVSSERGRDPRKFTLFAFGGSGPPHAVGLAEMLDIRKILVPPHSGVFSAFGLLFSDVEHHLMRTHYKSFNELDLDLVNKIIGDLAAEGKEILDREGFEPERQKLQIQMDIKYEGQASELPVWMPADSLSEEVIKGLGNSFDEEHERTFGHRVSAPYQLVNIRMIARGLPTRPRVPERLEIPKLESNSRSERSVYFGERYGWLEVPVLHRLQLSQEPMAGPILIEEYDTTTVVHPGWQASLDPRKNIILDKI